VFFDPFRLRNDLYCVEWGVKLYSLHSPLFDPLFLDRGELGSVPLNRTGGHSTSAWCQLGNGLRIMNGGSGLWKRLRSRMGHALDDDDVPAG